MIPTPLLHLISMLDSRTMLDRTYYDKIENDVREKVFMAYDYDMQTKRYYLVNPELLTEDIIKKLI